MALAEELPVYQKMFSLFNLILDARDRFPKSYKYAFGEKLMMVGLECLELIQMANSDMRNRVAYLNDFAIRFSTLELMLRVCKERNLIPVNQYAQILHLSGTVGKMATGWRRSSAKPESSSPTWSR